MNVIGRVIEAYAKRFGYGVVRDFTGHGIGTAFHSGLIVPHYDAAPNYATVIEPGMTFTVEPMLTLGTYEWDMWDDGWTVVTKDRRRSARSSSTRCSSPNRARRSSPCPDGRRPTAGDADQLVGCASWQDAAGFGIDIGGSGIKGCPVDLDAGGFAADRLPDADPVTLHADGRGRRRRRRSSSSSATRRGRGRRRHVPGGDPARRRADRGQRRQVVDRHGRRDPAASRPLGRPVRVVNDADAAGYAETRYGAAKDAEGTVFMATLGTGIGSALIVDGVLVPNTELGHLEVDGKDAETRAADSVRDAEGLYWEQWAKRLTPLLQRRRGSAVAGPHRRRRRREQEGREVPAAARHPDADRAGEPANDGGIIGAALLRRGRGRRRGAAELSCRSSGRCPRRREGRAALRDRLQVGERSVAPEGAVGERPGDRGEGRDELEPARSLSVASTSR